MSQNATPASQASTQAEAKKPNLRWRVNEIVIAAVIAVACAVIFWIWDIAVSPATKTALVAAPEFRPIIGGAWLLGGTLGGLLIRKPGAALFCEIVAAFISVLFTGGAWSGEILLAGLIQGIGAEVAFAIFGYRRWNATVAIFAGALCGLFMGGNEIFIYYPDMEPVKAIIYVACSVISGAVIAGFLAWILVQNLAKTGVLSSLASGKTRR
ncbi:ECF transporter S component [Rothia mucilaginosa]|jgi:ABC transporter, permease protein|uniref:ECF transporter S component n=1 Tax=Rothia mucilaginosa TaxID=43675 RepID=UPI0025FF4706|nr:ECF transporter S component [Rothia mucilaginosa]